MPLKRRADTETVRETLALRRALLPLFTRDGIDAERLDAAAKRSERSWDLFLTCECCAVRLAAQLRTAGLLERLPAEIQALIGRREMAELQRVLAARQLLDELDRVSAELSIPFIVLKGGALVAEGERVPLDLGDVDVLIPSEAALEVWRALSDRAWRLKSGEPMPVRPEQSDVNHLPALVSPSGGLPLELHTSLDYGIGARAPRTSPTRPLNDRRSLQRLIGPYGVVTTLRHSVIKHPHRRGHLRDLLLLKDTLVEDVAAVDEVAREIDADRYAPELHDMLRQANALASGDEPKDTDATARFVAWKYATRINRRGLLGALIPGWTGVSYIALERPEVRRLALAAQLRYAFGAVPPDSPFHGTGARGPARGGLSTVAGASRRAAGRVLRTLYRTSLIVLLAALGSRIRHRIDAMITT